MLPRPPPSTLFPYTTLFRSFLHPDDVAGRADAGGGGKAFLQHFHCGGVAVQRQLGHPVGAILSDIERSEEHTSELQSHHDLVCRLLLEKKKTKHTETTVQQS